ncbi:hypothetical protein OHR68_09770 [Spirillospora sp. NBC_00431]
MTHALAAALAGIADYLLTRAVTVTPRVCDGCGRTWTRITPAQATDIGARRLPTCRRRSCTGRLWPAPIEATDRLIRDVRKTAAPGWTPGTAAKADGWKEPKTMTTIIPRHARDLHAGDVITHDPDHDRPVRWRVTRPPAITSDGEYALADYTDLDSGGHGIAYYRVLTDLSVEPVGGAA